MDSKPDRKANAKYRKKRSIREKLADAYDDELLFMDGYDCCIVGVAGRIGFETMLVYDREKVLETLVKEGMTYEDAVDFHEFNQAGSYVGERTPMFITLLEDIP